MFEKVSWRHIRVNVVEGQLVFEVKLSGAKADIACGKLHRLNSKVDKHSFKFNPETDILTFQPPKESLPIKLDQVQNLLEEVVRG